MLEKKVKKYLKENEIELLPEYKNKFRQILIDYGAEKSSSFIELMSTYAGEFSGSDGTIVNVADDLSQEGNSNILNLQQNHNLDRKYLQLLTAEYDDYLLYNIDDDSVILIEGMNDIKLQRQVYDKKWETFDEFLIDFFELD